VKNNINKEIKEIGKIINQVHILDVIKREIYASGNKKIHSSIIGGEYVNSPNYDFVIDHDGDENFNIQLKRRLRKALSNIEISNLNNIVNRVMLGIRFSNRRGQKNNKV